MLFKRGTGAISRMKMIIGMIICLLTVITGTANKIEPTVMLDVASEVTTQSMEINFVLENKGNATISQSIFLNSFEKKVDGQWQEMPFKEGINWADANFKVNPADRYFFPNEAVECKFKINWLSTPDGEDMTTLDAGEYKVTFGVQYYVKDDAGYKVVYPSCEFEVKAA